MGKEFDLRHALDIAIKGAEIAGKNSLSYFNAGIKVEYKRDASPVTQADREGELLLKEYLLKSFPEHSFLGEEFGETAGNPDYRWIVDPIDGTKSFIHGVPLYATLVGLEIKGKPTIGVIHLPGVAANHRSRYRVWMPRSMVNLLMSQPSISWKMPFWSVLIHFLKWIARKPTQPSGAKYDTVAHGEMRMGMQWSQQVGQRL